MGGQSVHDVSAKRRPNKERERRLEAREVALYIRNFPAVLDRVCTTEVADKGQGKCERIECASDFLFRLGKLLARNNPAGFLRLVADALDGTLKDYRPGSHDEKIEAVWRKVWFGRIATGFNFCDPQSWPEWPSFPEFKKEFTHTFPLLTIENFQFRRSLKRLGYELSPAKHGRPRAKK